MNVFPCWEFGDCNLWAAFAGEDDVLLGSLGLSCCASSATSQPLLAPYGVRDGEKAVSQLQHHGQDGVQLPAVSSCWQRRAGEAQNYCSGL